METDIQQQAAGNDEEGHEIHHDGHQKVTVNIDKKEVKVRSGNYMVAEFKATVGVDAAKELDEIIKGTLTPLDDGATINIQGCEKFISHVRAGGSS